MRCCSDRSSTNRPARSAIRQPQAAHAIAGFQAKPAGRLGCISGSEEGATSQHLYKKLYSRDVFLPIQGLDNERPIHWLVSHDKTVSYSKRALV